MIAGRAAWQHAGLQESLGLTGTAIRAGVPTDDRESLQTNWTPRRHPERNRPHSPDFDEARWLAGRYDPDEMRAAALAGEPLPDPEVPYSLDPNATFSESSVNGRPKVPVFRYGGAALRAQVRWFLLGGFWLVPVTFTVMLSSYDIATALTVPWWLLTVRLITAQGGFLWSCWRAMSADGFAAPARRSSQLLRGFMLRCVPIVAVVILIDAGSVLASIAMLGAVVVSNAMPLQPRAFSPDEPRQRLAFGAT